MIPYGINRLGKSAGNFSLLFWKLILTLLNMTIYNVKMTGIEFLY